MLKYLLKGRKNMRIAICDDENAFTQKLLRYIDDKYRSLDLLINTFDCGEDLLSYYRKGNPHYDIILLDIEMKGLNGLETAKFLRQFDPNVIIIFVTSHEELACNGYEVSAFRFITKPINGAKLIEAIEAAKAQKQMNKTISVKTIDGEFSLRLGDVQYFEAQNQQTAIYTDKGKYIHRFGIGEYEKNLKLEGFYLIHRSYLVNLKYVKGFAKQEVFLEQGIKLPLSRLRYKDFSDTFHRFISQTAF